MLSVATLPGTARPRTHVSVIIPTYNRAKLLPHTLAAIRAQALPPAEIIVVDDGSTDSTPSLLADLAPEICTIQVPNGGDRVARNVGIEATTGDFVAFCDSDGVWHPRFLAEMAHLWQAEPALTAAFGKFVLVQNDRWGEAAKFTDAPAGFWDGLRPLGPGFGVFGRPITDRLIGFQPFFPSGLVAHRTWFRSIGGWDASVGRRLSGDFATGLRLNEHARPGILRAPPVGIRKHAGNISGNDIATALGEADVLERVLTSHPALAPHASPIRASIHLRRERALACAFVPGKYQLVREIAALLPADGRRLSGRIKQAAATLAAPPRACLDPLHKVGAL